MSENFSRLLAGMRASAEMFSITYWIPHEDDELEDASPFQAFLPGILETAHLFEHIVRMPLDMRELFAARADVLNARQVGLAKMRVLPVQLSAFDALVRRANPFFHVVVSKNSLATHVADVIEKSGRDWLHFSELGGPRAIPLDQVNDKVFEAYLRRVAAAQTDPRVARAFAEFLQSPLRQWSPMSVDCPSYAHNITRPNEIALAGMGLSMRGVEPMGPGAPNLYVSGSVRCARAVSAMRAKILSKYGLAHHANDLTICLDSVEWWISRTDIRAKLVREGLPRVAANFVHALVKRSGYVSEVAMPGQQNSGRMPDDETVQWVLATRAHELRALSSALIIHSGFTLTPVMRLNPGMNKVRPTLLEIGSCARGSGPHRDFKLNKLARRLSAEMSAIAGSRMLSGVRGPTNRIGEMSLIADLPLELLSIDDMPLALKHDVSRVPCNPGNVMFAECARNDITFISKSRFDEVLVIRSFSKSDPIAGHLEAALVGRMRGDASSVPRVRFQDVANADEFVEAVSSYNGAMLIFDGHGSRDSKTGVGSIVVGGQPLDIWTLRGKLSLPPIVLLSACDTYPIDGSHGSSAIGMLALGARTVLGTLLPVHSIRSSALLSRLLLRLSEFLPIAMARFPHGVNWRYLMSGMLRMVYASELGYSYGASVRMDWPSLSEVLAQANMDINQRDPRWLDQLQKRLATASDRPLSSVKTHREKYAWLTDSMNYVQLGRPELIHVVDKPPTDVWRAESELTLAQQAGRSQANALSRPNLSTQPEGL